MTVEVGIGHFYVVDEDSGALCISINANGLGVAAKVQI